MQRAARLVVALLLALAPAPEPANARMRAAGPAQEGRVRGVVRDPAGKPIAQARIGVIDPTTAAMRETSTDAEGRFEVAGLAAGGKYRVVASKYLFEGRAVADVVAGGADVVLMLQTRRTPPPRDSAPAEAAERGESIATFKVAVDLVVCNVAVRDGAGKPVAGLGQNDFRLFDDGVEVEIVQFQEEQAPLSAVLMVDTSSSMEGTPLEEARRAARVFIETSAAGTEIALASFGDRVTLLQPFTTGRALLIGALDRLQARGGTALYDALAHAIESMPGAKNRRHFVVVLSDGKDEDSSRRFAALERLLESSDAVVYAVGEYAAADRTLFLNAGRFYKEPGVEANLNPIWVLRRLAELSGGEAHFPAPGAPLGSLFERIARELPHHYVLGFTRRPTDGAAKFHALEVRLRDAARSGISIRTRKGYLGPGAEPVSAPSKEK